jgi:transcriptional regulator with XRE-family HTH domain
METKRDPAVIRQQAIALRLAGKSRREIMAVLGPMSNHTLNVALRDTSPPDWVLRPRAKDDLHAQAKELRAQGLSYLEIANRLGVSKSSVSLWVRDLPRPPHLSPEESRKRSAAGVRRYWEREYAARDEERKAIAREIGELTEREILIAGAVAYWCEGTKSKPWRQTGARVTFMNSDPGLIRFFLCFLDAAGIQRSDLIFRVSIHESADVEAAQRFWAELTEAPADQFRTPTLKRHNPKTVRKNTGESYRGCLTISVRRSGELYRRIEGWMSAITASQALGAA